MVFVTAASGVSSGRADGDVEGGTRVMLGRRRLTGVGLTGVRRGIRGVGWSARTE